MFSRKIQNILLLFCADIVICTATKHKRIFIPGLIKAIFCCQTHKGNVNTHSLANSFACNGTKNLQLSKKYFFQKNCVIKQNKLFRNLITRYHNRFLFASTHKKSVPDKCPAHLFF